MDDVAMCFDRVIFLSMKGKVWDVKVGTNILSIA
jgi:hypothetical protein